MITFFNSFSFTQDIIFTFGFGIAAVILSLFFWKYNKLFAASGMILGVSSVLLGVTRILEEHGYLEHDSLIRLSPISALFLFIPLFYFSSKKMAKNNPAILKLLNMSFIFLLIVLVPFLIILIAAIVKS